jgi:hypothetical protein
MDDREHTVTAQDYLLKLFSQEVTGDFRGSSKADFDRWRDHLTAMLGRLFVHHDRDFADVSCSDVRVLSEKPYHGCLRREAAFVNPTYGALVPVSILVPPPGSRKGAGIICQHGHGSCGRLAVIGDRDDPDCAREIESLSYDFGLGLAQAGYHVVAIDLFGFGSRAEPRGAFAARTHRDPCDLIGLFLSIAGRNSVTIQVGDIRRAVSLLQDLDGVDPERIGMAGLSQGGRMTMYAGAIDARLRVLVASGSCNTFRDRVALMSGACGAQVLPGLFPAADTPELFGVMAPRPLQLQWGARDPLIIEEYAAPGIERISRCYRAAGADDAFMVDRFDGGHQFHLEPAITWFDRWL